MPITDQNRNCWIAAVVVGLLVWLFTAGFGDLSWFSGLVLAVITTSLLGAFLNWLTSGSAQSADDLGWSKPAERRAFVTPSTKLEANGSTAGETSVEPVSGDHIAPAGESQLQGNEEERPISARNDIYGSKAVKADTRAKSEKVDVASKKDATPKKADKTTPAKKKTVSKKTAPSDDLKEIKGVGPKLEELLHENGIMRFAQIAEWSDKDIDHFAELIGRMGGRIRSDEWVEQARILAAGGETEFSKRVEKGDVYT